jgi:plastocyanin
MNRQADLPLATRALRFALVVVAGTLALAKPDVARAGAPVTIEINHFTFGPNDITIDAGTTVEWVNHDETIHNIVMPTARIASPGMDTGDHFTHSFDQPGDYTYLCALHPHMTGVVHVKAKG